MTVWDELKARGLIAQVTDEEEIKEMVNNGKATFYIGFDPTADSLHVGHFMALCLMKRLQMAGLFLHPWQSHPESFHPDKAKPAGIHDRIPHPQVCFPWSPGLLLQTNVMKAA